MSYDISFKVKVEGINKYVNVGDCDANITCNVGEMIRKSTGLKWINQANNGLCIDIIPSIVKGYMQLDKYPGKYREYEDADGWGTVAGTKRFFYSIIESWESFCKWHEELIHVVSFWIE